MLFYYVQTKERHDPGVNIRGKASVANINETGGFGGGGALRLLAGIFGGRSP